MRPTHLLLLLLISLSSIKTLQSKCTKSCDVALASYYIWQNSNLTFISKAFDTTTQEILNYNSQIANQDSIIADTRINVPFTCDCVDDDFLAHMFTYSVMSGDTYDKVAKTYYSNLTTAAWIKNFNSYDATNIPDTATINVTVNCSCGDPTVSKEYGLFVTWPLREGEGLDSIANQTGVSSDVIKSYNLGVNFSQGSGLIYVPGKDENDEYPTYTSSTSGGIGIGVIVGIVVGCVAGLVILALGIYFGIYRKKRVKGVMHTTSQELSALAGQVSQDDTEKTTESYGLGSGVSPLTGISVDKSVEFTYEELAKETDDFSLANKIGQGGFGAVYYAELRGEKAAIKKMDMQASREFLAELKVLTHVHHLNLVRLIGYCVEGSLFLVYEFIENGNLSQHLRGTGRDPLPWSTRVQIALDSARGLEYIHEHTVPVYIHRDIKSANILIDKNFRAKVADFGLTKLTEVGGSSLPTRLVGTFGYMPPEYAQYGDVSPKVDVYAFGVVLYELISAKEAIVRATDATPESKGLVGLFEDAFSQPDPTDDLRNLIDPSLEDNYSFESVRKMAQLAKACTQENPQLRPSMRSIVVALMTLSSSTEDWDVGSFYENQGLVNLMSGR
ncbi:hypothetical protein ACFE04_030912 [Oxalis oulophora]